MLNLFKPSFLPVLLASIALLPAFALALPFLSPSSSPAPRNYIAASKSSHLLRLSKRETGGVKVCTGAQFTGSCWSGAWPLDECIALND